MSYFHMERDEELVSPVIFTFYRIFRINEIRHGLIPIGKMQVQQNSD